MPSGDASTEGTPSGGPAPSSPAPDGVTSIAQAPRTMKYLALTAMMFAVAMTFIDQTIVAVAVPDIQAELGLSSTGVQWVINGYLLALAALFALGGRASDIVGHRRMVLIGVIVFAIASGLCGATPTGSLAETWIVTFRVIQGVGAAILFPATLAIVVSAFDIRERGKALAIFFGISGGLTAAGPILGGILTRHTWRAIFWINLPVALVSIVLTFMTRVRTARRREPLDYRGAALAALGMGLSVYGLQQTSAWGWGSLRSWACIVGGLIVLVAFVLVERRVNVPLIKVRIFRDRAFSANNGVLFVSAMAFIPVFFFASVYSQLSLGFDATGAGLYLIIYFGGFATAAQVAGHMLDRGGAKAPMLIGCVLGAAGYALWGWKLTTLSEGGQWPFIVLAGAGVGFIIGPASTDAVNRAINASYGEVTGITQTIRNYGSSLGLAILGAMLVSLNSSKIVKSLVGFGLPHEQAERVGSALAQQGQHASAVAAAFQAIPPPLRGRVREAMRHDFASATQLIFYGMALVLAISLAVALLHPGGQTSTGTQNEPAAGAGRPPA